MSVVGLLALVIVAQVPPLDVSARPTGSLRDAHEAILAEEGEKLKALAQRLTANGDQDSANEVRSDLPPLPDRSGAERFVPLPEVVAARIRRPGLPNVPVGTKPVGWKAERAAIRNASAEALFALAKRAASLVPRDLALADAGLRAVIVRQPDHSEARRLLGYVPHDGGWATPYAVQQFKADKIFHPLYGWVSADWVPHLEKGELPARGRVNGQGQNAWIPAEQADAQRKEYQSGWSIRTEHFLIRANVPLSEAIAFGHHLEILHELFGALLADVLGDNLPLAQRIKNPLMVGEKASDPHLVSYFAEKDQFVAFLRTSEGDGITGSLGLYLPAKTSRAKRGHAYFYRDLGQGELPVTATLYHEVSHQLLFESGVAGAHDYGKNIGNFWVFEGLGTYFETLVILADGVVQIGGLADARNREARKTFARPEALIPLSRFVRMDQATFKADHGGDVYLNYQEAIALTTFLMHAHDGAYREGFLDYVRDACRGKLGHGARSLEERVGEPYSQIQAELLIYLKGGPGK